MTGARIDAYADSGFLLSVYSPDANSEVACGEFQQNRAAIAFTHFHRLELFNGLRLKKFRREITDREMNATISALEENLEAGVLREIHLEWEDVLEESRRLSANFTEKFGIRSLDIIHVASAIVLKSRVFFSFDDRQRTMATAAGLKVRPPS